MRRISMVAVLLSLFAGSVFTACSEEDEQRAKDSAAAAVPYPSADAACLALTRTPGVAKYDDNNTDAVCQGERNGEEVEVDLDESGKSWYLDTGDDEAEKSKDKKKKDKKKTKKTKKK